MMTPEQLDAQFESDLAFARARMLDSGSVSPMFLVHGATGLAVISAPFRNAEEKASYFEFVRMHALATSAHAIGFVMEAWLTVLTPGAEPERIEVIWVGQSARLEPGKLRHRFQAERIERDAAGAVVGLKPFATQADATGGALTHLLASDPPPELVEAARLALEALQDRLKVDEVSGPTIH